MARFFGTVASSLALVAGASQPLLAHEPVDRDAIIATLRALEQAQNDAANNKTGGGGVITADDVMVVMPEGLPTRGVRPEMSATLNNPTFHIETMPGEAWVSASGDLAVTVAAVEFSLTLPDGTSVARSGTRQFVWGRDAGGDWQVVTIFNGGARPTAMAPDGQPLRGTYDIVPANGASPLLWTVNADGTFSVHIDGAPTGGGTWTVENGNICLTRELPARTDCYTSSSVAGSSWISTAPNGEEATITRRTAR